MLGTFAYFLFVVVVLLILLSCILVEIRGSEVYSSYLIFVLAKSVPVAQWSRRLVGLVIQRLRVQNPLPGPGHDNSPIWDHI